ncbi:MAG: PIG-L family deacetylase [Ilumatobacteraceae bacterium]
MPAPAIDLSHPGTAPTAWQPVVEALPLWQLQPQRHRRVVVVAPHPDDETLGVGGLIADASSAGMDILVISLTDGEAAFTEVGLGERRHHELKAAMECLAPVAALTIERVGLPDGGLTDRHEQIAAAITDRLQRGDLVFAPLSCDGHPDHDAVGAVVESLVRDDIDVCFYPIWSWHWHQPSTSVIGVSGRRSVMSPAAAAAKAAALECYRSQTAGDDPILPDHFRGRFDSPFEVIVCRR